ncbi:MAG: ABC transporter permease [Planctomycetota bacterium]|nr:MAG: ABC transporter permease [Planctomycetota bacterium]
MPESAATKRSLVIRGLDRVGGFCLDRLALIGGVYYLLQDVAMWLWRSMVDPRVRFGRTALTTQLVRVGTRATGIVMLVCGCVGLILALQMEPVLAEYGQTEMIANIVGVSITRELGPLIAAIVMTGFAGASIAAELGTMVVGEEIEALEAHALNPVRFLVVSRVCATTIGLILLTVIADVTAIVAGGAMSVGLLGVPYELYRANTFSAIDLPDFLTGLVKACVFGIILSALACYHGLSVTGGAAGVGRATTATVVQAVVAVIIADLVFTGMFYAVGWG